MRISDWSSDVCSSDLLERGEGIVLRHAGPGCKQGCSFRGETAIGAVDNEYAIMLRSLVGEALEFVGLYFCHVSWGCGSFSSTMAISARMNSASSRAARFSASRMERSSAKS